MIINNGNKTLSKVGVTIYYLNNENVRIAERSEFPVYPYLGQEDESLLKPNYEKEFEIEIESKAPKNWGGEIEIEITKIEFYEN